MLVETLWGAITMRPDPSFPLGTDAMVLADFTRLPKRAAVCDLGAGSGALGLLLCGKSAACRVTGVELRPEACDLARLNIADNALEDRLAVLQGDLREIRTLLPAGSFDAVVSNPPYFPAGSGPVSAAAPDARTDALCPPDALCRAAAWLLRTGGRFSVVYRPERLCDLLCSLRAARLEPKRLRFVRHRPDAEVSLVLVEAALGAKPCLKVEQDLLLHTQDGAPSADFQRIYHTQQGGG